MFNLDVLKKLGLTEYESKVYLALANLGTSSVKEIVNKSKIPRNKAYEVLNKLEEKQKIILVQDIPKKYKIINPESFKEDLNNLNNTVDSIIKLVNDVKQNESLSNKDSFLILKGKKAVHDQLYYQNKKTKFEILTCNKHTKKLFRNLKSIKEAVDRGVKVKVICTTDFMNNHKDWIKAGAILRIYNKNKFGPLMPRITIFDSEIARLTIGEPEIPKDEDYLTLWSESKSFALMLKSQFNYMWKYSEPIEKYINRIKNERN